MWSSKATHLITARKRSLRRLCFYTSVCPQVCGGGACVAGGHAWWGACVVGACVVGGVHGRGGVHGGGRAWQGGGIHGNWTSLNMHLVLVTVADPWGDMAPLCPQQILRDTVNERAVRILLECILVLILYYIEWLDLTSTSHKALELVAAVADVLPVVRRNTYCFFLYSSPVKNFSCSAWNMRTTSPFRISTDICCEENVPRLSYITSITPSIPHLKKNFALHWTRVVIMFLLTRHFEN